jgi:hypothetical protein
MSLKKLGAGIFAVLAISAVMASSAFAAPTTGNSQWYINGSKLASGSSETVTCAKTGTEPITLASTVAGAAVKLTATGVECVESKITQNGTMAEDSGKLRFTGVTVDEPAGCSTVATLTTEALKTHLEMDGTTTYDKFEPAAGETEKFVTIKLTKCAAEGSYPVKGYVRGRSNTTGTAAVNQPLTFDSSSNAVSALTLGGNAATITGNAANTLTSGLSWLAEES